jgi:hypothetical protein
MIAGNLDWFIGMWSKESASAIEDDLARQGLTHEAIAAKWMSLKQGTIELVSRIDTGPYVVITFAPNASSRLVAVLKQDKGKWQLTNELKDDPALASGPAIVWGADGKTTISRVVR